jgi:hypothetical protein
MRSAVSIQYVSRCVGGRLDMAVSASRARFIYIYISYCYID